ncbi:MAG: hypothetical protein NC311_11160 [Muribaculaceae bacterium]|nr:hypothetical protein [Muribaculaceae bacterium]
MEMPESDERKWYVLHFINKSGKPTPKRHIDDFNKEGHSLELFAPIVRMAHAVNGKVEYKEKSLTYYYVFVKGVFDEIKELCGRQGNDLSFLLDRGSANRYATISDSSMDNFKIIARAHTNTVPFFNIEDVELSEGDLVEVVGGDYDGLKGSFMPKPRSNKGNLVIAVTAALGVVAWDINAKNIRILEFANDTRRQYDLVDSFIPKLLPILRKFHAGEDLTTKEKSQLTVFNRRMGAVTTPNHKAEAKLLATLMCVQILLGDLAAFRLTEKRFEKRKAALTNFWTTALVELMMSVALNDMKRLKDAYAKLPNSTDALTNTQKQLTEEFQHYLPSPQNSIDGNNS